MTSLEARICAEARRRWAAQNGGVEPLEIEIHASYYTSPSWSRWVVAVATLPPRRRDRWRRAMGSTITEALFHLADDLGVAY